MTWKSGHSYQAHKQAKLTIDPMNPHRGGKTVKESKELISQKPKYIVIWRTQ